MSEDLHLPLTRVRDPFGTHDSFGAHNNARLRAFLDGFGFEYEFASSTEYYTRGPLRRGAADGAGALRRRSWRSCCRRSAGWREPARDLFAVPAGQPEDRPRAAGADAGAQRRQGHDRLRGARRRARRAAGHRRQRQAAVEARLGHALGRAGRRLRDVRQGPDPVGGAVGQDLPGARRQDAGAFQLRAVPRRGRAEDLQVEGQRAEHGGVADLCQPREPWLFHVPEAQDREAAAFRRDPQGGGRVPPAVARLSRTRTQKAAAGEPGLSCPRRRRAGLDAGRAASRCC